MNSFFRVSVVCFLFLSSFFFASQNVQAEEWGFFACLALDSDDVAEDPASCASCQLACVKGLSPAAIAACKLEVGRVCVTAGAKAALEEAEEVVCTKGPEGCCIESVADAEGAPGLFTTMGEVAATAQSQSAANRGTGEVLKEDCKDGRVFYYADCFCMNKEGSSKFEKPAHSPGACRQLCEGEGLTVDQSRGIGAAGRLNTGGEGATVSTLEFINALCFTPDECSEAGGSFESSGECTNSKGKCVAPEPVLTLSSPILGQTSVTGLRGYVELGFRFLLAITVLAAAIAFIFGGIKYIIGSTTGDITSAKEYMVNAVIGLLLVFGAMTILNTLNPATTRYDKLKIYLINKQEFSKNEFCKDYAGKAGKPLKYADAGDPPGSAPYEGGVFDKDVSKTICGSEYYAEGFAGKTCKGLACPSASEVCLPCKAGITQCFGSTKGSTCVPVAIAAEIRYSEGVKPLEVWLLALCNHIQPGANEVQTVSHVEDNVAGGFALGVTESGGDTLIFSKPIDPASIEDVTEECTDAGGLRGVMLGVLYRDTSGIVGTIAAATEGPNANTNDVLIMGKRDCAGTPTKFAGYADGHNLATDVGDMENAVYCGYLNDYAPYMSPSDLYWTPEEFTAAFNGSGKAIECHSALNKSNAPGDPATKFYPTCSY